MSRIHLEYWVKRLGIDIERLPTVPMVLTECVRCPFFFHGSITTMILTNPVFFGS